MKGQKQTAYTGDSIHKRLRNTQKLKYAVRSQNSAFLWERGLVTKRKTEGDFLGVGDSIS